MLVGGRAGKHDDLRLLGLFEQRAGRQPDALSCAIRPHHQPEASLPGPEGDVEDSVLVRAGCA